MGRFSSTIFALVILISYSKTSRRTFKVSNLDQRNPYSEKHSICHCLAPNHKGLLFVLNKTSGSGGAQGPLVQGSW